MMKIKTNLYSKVGAIFMLSLCRKSSVSYNDMKIVLLTAATVQVAMMPEIIEMIISADQISV